MAKREQKGKAMETTGEELIPTTVKISRAQWDTLRREAMRRSLEAARGERRPDASKLIREAIDDWCKKNRVK